MIARSEAKLHVPIHRATLFRLSHVSVPLPMLCPLLRPRPAAHHPAATATVVTTTPALAHQLRSSLAQLLPRPPLRQRRTATPTSAHYRFPHPVEPGRLTGSKSKKVIRLWQQEAALETARAVATDSLACR